MKKIANFLIIASIAFLTAEVNADAQLLKNLLNKGTENTTAAVSEGTSNGQQAGAALKALYTQYKTDGKLDMTNLSNILNLTTLSNNIKGLKGMSNKSAFYKDFATGLIKGSNSLVNKSNNTAVMNGLTNLVNNVDLSALTESTAQQTTTSSASSSATTSSAASALTGLLSGSSSSSNTTEAISNASEIASSVTNILKLFK